MTFAEVGHESSYFLLVKISFPIIDALADPCFPGFAVEYYETLHGNPLSMQYPPFFTEPAGNGVQSDDPASP